MDQNLVFFSFAGPQHSGHCGAHGHPGRPGYSLSCSRVALLRGEKEETDGRDVSAQC